MASISVFMSRLRSPLSLSLGLIIFTALAAFILAPSSLLILRNFAENTFKQSSLDKLRPFSKLSASSSIMEKTPVYFLSHGGPNIMYEKGHPVWPKLQEIGREITQKVKPKAIVVFSAHWQGGPDTIEINTSENTDLIYDFYGFPSHYYKEKYPNTGSTPIANKVQSLLTKAGIKSEGKRRGLDHGVWASFKVAFEPETNPLNIPVVQVSLFDNEDPHKHYALGRAVSSLREENIVIICSGMAVHNLRDLRKGMMSISPLPYAVSFDNALKTAVTVDPNAAGGREEKMASLLDRKDARQAHPTFEHLLPLYVGAGAAAEEKGDQLWTLPEGSMSWAQYRFGKVAA